MMKQIALIALTALTLAYPAMAKTNKPYSKEVETFLDATAATCPTCADVSEFMAVTLKEKCNQPITVKHIQHVTTEHPLFVFLLALQSMDPDSKPLSFQSAAESVNCENQDKWVEDTRRSLIETYQKREKQAQKSLQILNP